MVRLLGWAAAFFGTVAMAVLLLFSALQDPGPVAASVAPRDPATVTDVDRELILNRIREGDLRALKGDRDEARKAWAEAARLGHGLWPVHEGLGDSYARAKLHEEAVKEYLTAEALVPEKLASVRASLAFRRGEALAAGGRPLEGIQAYLETGQPAMIGARVADLAKADPAAAVALVSRHAEIHDPRLFRLVASVCDALERRPEAARAFARYCIAVSPWDEALNRQAIDRLRAIREFDRAIEVCRAWIRSAPQALAVYEIMGDLHREAGRGREALVAYSSIVDVRPGDAAAHRMLGEIFRRLNRVDDAVGQFEAARKARPEDAATYSTLVALHESKGDVARAEEVLLEACRRFGNNPELRSRLVASLQEQITRLKAAGKTEEIRALRRKLADLNVPEGGLYDLKIIMTWDARSDVDMDVIEPGGAEVNHRNPHSKSGGHYYVDNTTAFGPETYTLKTAVPGTYRIGAHLHGTTPSTVKFVVILYEDTPREERREGSFVLERQAEQKFIPDVVLR